MSALPITTEALAYLQDAARLALVEELEALGVDRWTAWLYAKCEADPPEDIVRALAARRAEGQRHAA